MVASDVATAEEILACVILRLMLVLCVVDSLAWRAARFSKRRAIWRRFCFCTRHMAGLNDEEENLK